MDLGIGPCAKVTITPLRRTGNIVNDAVVLLDISAGRPSVVHGECAWETQIGVGEKILQVGSRCVNALGIMVASHLRGRRTNRRIAIATDHDDRSRTMPEHYSCCVSSTRP